MKTLVPALFALLALAACASDTTGAIDVPGDVVEATAETSVDLPAEMPAELPTELPTELPPTELPPADPCGNGVCDPGETCWTCPADCACKCGDGVCTHGESCATCPVDCDCDTLAATPPMGWNSWNKFGCGIDEDLIKGVADAYAESGLREAGYRYLNLDDCWQTDRDAATGEIVADPVKFKGGMTALADYVHGKGLKFGVYTCAGTQTCAKRPGSKDHELQDVKTYAGWGVDYFKVDWCNTEGLLAEPQYALFHQGVVDSKRPMIFSLCSWGEEQVWMWGGRLGQVWRTSGDIDDSFFRMILNFDAAAMRAPYAGPGHWNDPDMLEVGNGNMTADEYTAHMSLWAILSAPLIAGNDLRTMTAETKAILANAAVIAVDQDPLGLQGVRVAEDNGFVPEIYAKPLALPGARAVVLFNRAPDTEGVDLSLDDVLLAPGSATVKDLWAAQDLAPLTGKMHFEVPGHAAVMLRVDGAEYVPPTGDSYLSDLHWKYSANSMKPLGRDAVGGSPLTVAGKAYAKGLGAIAGSVVTFPLGARCSAFDAQVALDDAGKGVGAVSFEVWADGKRLFDSGTMAATDAPKAVHVALDGKVDLKLVTVAQNRNETVNLADWLGAKISCR